jgi:geranylgeranylglycerol-phosphate geranylgeranyltransferase
MVTNIGFQHEIVTENNNEKRKSKEKTGSFTSSTSTTTTASASTPLCRQFYSLPKLFWYYAKARTPPIYCFPIATILSFLLISKAHTLGNGLIVIGIGLASYFLGLATYVYNDITDIDVDKINRKDQSEMTQSQSKRGLVLLVTFLFGTAAIVSLIISYYAFLIAVIFIVLGVSYSHPRVDLKSKFPLKTVVTAAGAGLLSLFGGAAAVGNGLCHNPIDHASTSILPLSTAYLAISFAIFYFIQSPMGDIGDIKGDRAAGRKTFPLVLGMNGTMAIMLSIPFVILAMDGLCYGQLHISVIGTLLIVITSQIVAGFIGWIGNHMHDPGFVKNKRDKVRFLNIAMQVSILIALL